MKRIWNASTTVRNPKRIRGFLEVCEFINGKQWNKETQCEYQILLIQEKLYTPKNHHKNLNLKSMTYDQAKEVFYSTKYKIDDYGIRGRTSLSVLEKFGFVRANRGIVEITDVGWALIENEISFTEAMDSSMLGWSFYDIKDEYINVKPFVAILHLINGVNNIYDSNEGITISEFGVFGMTINNYNDISKHIEAVDGYRKGKINDDDVLMNYSNSYDYDDYLDNNIKYMKESSLLKVSISKDRVKFNNEYIAKINKILKTDDGRAY